MKVSSSRASSRPSAVERNLDRLIRDIRAAYREAAKHGGQGCAEIHRALVRAEALRDTLNVDDSQSTDWGRLTWALTYLLECVKLLCSSINCIFSWEIKHDYWVHHKAIASSTGSVARRTGRDTWCYEDIPLYD